MIRIHSIIHEMLKNITNASNVLKLLLWWVVSCNCLDNKFDVVNYTICAMKNFAKGFRKDLIESRELFVTLIEKFKEKKEIIVSAVFIFIDLIITHSLAIDEIVDILTLI